MPHVIGATFFRAESFENEDTARLMNELYVSIKVDREERPDLDALYMEAVQALTGSGGWPMTVFLTPDGAPFYGGTYFPPQDRYGMPSFTRVLRGVADLYRNQREDVEQQAQAFREHYAGQAQTGLKLPDDFNPATATISAETLTAAASVLVSQFDAVEGGFGPAPKFPHPMGLEFLLRIEARQQGERRERVALQPARRAPAAADAVDAGQDGGRRHLRSGGRRLPSLLDRQDLADAALREDALRQCAARAGLPARLAAHRRAALPSHRRGDAGLCFARDDRSQRRGSTRRRTPTARARRASSTSGRRRSYVDLLG